eukprot:514990_1
MMSRVDAFVVFTGIGIWHWLIVLLYFSHSTVMIDGLESIPPVVDHETYICSKHADNSTYFANQYIECRSDSCEVRCDVNGGCHNLMINASLSSSLIVDCDETHSCRQLVVMAPSADFEMQCTATESCYEAQIYAQDTSKINVECSSFHACRGIVIEAATMTNDLDLNCITDDTCYQSKIHCPRDAHAACNIKCLSQTSCQSIDVFINDALDNTLDLECSNITECTGVIHCATNYFANSTFLQNPTTNALYCGTYNAGCCPFVQGTITCASGSDCVVDCSNATMTSCVSHKIDATNANSLSLQCGAGGYGCEQALIQCPVRNDTICNITCHSCKQIYIKPSIDSTVSCIGANSCEDMLSSFNGNLNEFNCECDDYRACYNVLMVHDDTRQVQGSMDSFDIKCTGWRACERIKIDLGYISDEFSLICTGQYTCYYLDLSLTTNVSAVTLSCIGGSSCERMVLSLNGNLTQFNGKCDGSRACYYAKMDVQMNSLSNGSLDYISDAFTLICTGVQYACEYMDLSFIGNVDRVYIQCGDESKADEDACYGGTITHSGQLINDLHFACYGSEAFRRADIYLYGQYIREFVWDCMSNESIPIDSWGACDSANLVLEASVDEMNVTCSGYNTCYNTEWHIGSPTTSSLATINRWNLQCIDDGAVHYSDGDLSCVYADIYVYSEKRINYLDIECDGGEMECFNLMTRLHGNAVIDYWNMECFDGSWNCEWVYMIFSDDSILSHANVNCDGDGRDGTCLGLWYDFDAYTSSEPLEMIYNCNTPHACEGGDINGRDLPSTLHITLNCNAADSCRNFVLDIEDSYYDSATRSWMSRAMDFGKFTLNCNGTNACNGMTIMCPMNENACNIECSAHDGSCENIDIVALTDSYPFGYLDLQCPSPETYTNNTACDGVTIGCSDTKLDIEYIYDYSAHQYTCSNTSDTHCCPLNGISSNPTHHPTVFTSNPTVDPTTDPTRHPSVQPTYNPTLEPTLPSLNPTVASQEPTMPTVYPVTVVIQIEYVFEDIPLDLITEIVEQTVNYVLNTSDLIESCGLTDDELRVNKTESGIQLSGQILACLDQAPQLVLITELVSELKGEIIDNINVETRLSITEHDVSLDVDVVNPSLSQQVTSNPIATHESTLISNDATQSGNIFTIRNISIVVTAVLILLLLFAAIYVYRRYKIKKVKKIEGNMQIEPAEMAATGAQKVIEESTENMQNTNCTNDNDGGNIETDDKEIVEMAIFSELPDEMEVEESIVQGMGEKAVVDTIGEASITFDGHTMNEKEQMGNGNTDNGACDV